MFNVCPQCGRYSVEKTIDPAGPFAVCPFCGYQHPFLQQPLFIITGASGSGKTAICLELVKTMQDHVVMETDILWGAIKATPEENYQDYRNTWLRVAKNIGQAGRPVVLCGTALPDQFEACPERRYFSTLYYLALVCDEQTLTARLQTRPEWRGAGTEEFIADMVAFNGWLQEHAATTQPAMDLYDTGKVDLPKAVEDVAAWIRQRNRSDQNQKGPPPA